MGDDAFGATVQLGGTASYKGAIWAIFMGSYRVKHKPDHASCDVDAVCRRQNMNMGTTPAKQRGVQLLSA
jgi:hypothetical protein